MSPYHGAQLTRAAKRILFVLLAGVPASGYTISRAAHVRNRRTRLILRMLHEREWTEPDSRGFYRLTADGREWAVSGLGLKEREDRHHGR